MNRLLRTGLIVLLILVLPVLGVAQTADQNYNHAIGADGNAMVTGMAGSATELVIPSQLGGRPVTSIGENAFKDFRDVVSVEIPEGVVSIGKGAFRDSINLKSVTLPSTLRTIGESVFSGCSSLERIVIPEGVTEIPDNAFFRCVNMEEVVFPKSLKSIGKLSFAVNALKTLDLPLGLESIGEQAFYGSRNLVELKLPDTLRRIDEWAFFVSESLTKVIMPAGLQAMPSNLFDKAVQLETIAIPASVRQIKDDALFGGTLKPAKLKVQGFPGSEAQNFAGRVGLPFEALQATNEVRVVNDAGENAAGGRYAIDLSSDVRSLQFNASTFPESLWPGVEWKSSSAKIATVTPYGVVLGQGKGEATITATAVDGSGATANFKVNVANLARSLNITGENAIPSKGRVRLTAEVLPETTDNKKVDWSISDESLATIRNNGEVRAVEVTSRKDLTVTATTQDGSGVFGTYDMAIFPLASEIFVSRGEQLLENKGVLAIDLASAENTIQLGAKVLPEDAIQRVEWKSSSPKVAEINDQGQITGLKKGKATITATTTDGTREKVTLTVNVANLSKSVEVTGDNEVVSGGKITLKAAVLPETTDNKKVDWTTSDENIARVAKNGVVTARKVEGVQEVTITATAQDGSGASAIQTITVRPEVTTVTLLRDGQPLEPKAAIELDISAGETSLQLAAQVDPSDAIQKVNWKSSNDRVATVDENGLVTVLRRGRVSITATAADGSRKRAVCELTIVNNAN